MAQLNQFDDVAVLNLDGELGPQEIQSLEREMYELLYSQHRKMVLNFEDVDHVHYPSVEALMGAVRKIKNYDVDLKFAALSDYNRKIFRFMGAEESVENFETVPDALSAFRSNWRTWH